MQIHLIKTNKFQYIAIILDLQSVLILRSSINIPYLYLKTSLEIILEERWIFIETIEIKIIIVKIIAREMNEDIEDNKDIGSEN